MEDLVVYTAGMRSEFGGYAEFIASPDREKVEDYIEIMKTTKPEGMIIVLMEKRYKLISTTPYIISE